MSRLQLSLACGDYDLLQPLLGGEVRAEGIDVLVVRLPSPERHWRMLHHEEFDVCELSLASYLVDRDRTGRFTAIPVFPHRRFRHGYIFVRTGGPVGEPGDLRGCRVGLRTFQNTAGLWVRGILQHDYGLDLRTVRWVAQDEEDLPLDLAPRGIWLERVPPGGNVDRMLVGGELDAVIYPEVLPSYRRGDPAVRRLFENYPELEKAYFRRTGIFPIMHTVVVRTALLERHPWVATNLLRAFEASKRECYRRFQDPRRVSLAWFLPALEEERRILGPDPWAYGFEPNRHTLEVAVQYAHEQGLTARRLEVAGLFAPSTLDQAPHFVE